MEMQFINKCTKVQNPLRHEFMPLWTDLSWRRDQWQFMTQLPHRPLTTYAWLNTHVHFQQENGRLYIWLSMEECWISATELFQRKPHKYFEPATGFSGQANPPEGRCDLTHRHTHTYTHRSNYCNPPADAWRVNHKVMHMHFNFTMHVRYRT